MRSVQSFFNYWIGLLNKVNVFIINNFSMNASISNVNYLTEESNSIPINYLMLNQHLHH